MKKKLLIPLIFLPVLLLSQTFELIYRTELDDWVGDAVLLNDEEVAFVVSSGVYGISIYPSKLFILNITTGNITDSANIEFDSPEYNFAGARVISALEDGTIIIRGFLSHKLSNERYAYIAHYDKNLSKKFDTIFGDIERFSLRTRIYDDTLMIFWGTYNSSPPRIDFLEERDIYGNLIREVKSIFNSFTSALFRTESHYHIFGDFFNPYKLINVYDLQVDTIMNHTHSFRRSKATASGFSNYYFIGAQRSRYPYNNLVLLKMSNSGEVLEEFESFTNRDSYFATNGIDLRDEYVFLGGTEFLSGGPGTFVSEPRPIQLIKLNHSGEVIWQKVYNYLDVNYRLEKVLATPDGGALLFATRYDWLDPIPFQRDVYILKVDSDGNTVVGTENITHSRPGVKVYPNPAGNMLNISLPSDDEFKVSIYDGLGRIIYSGKHSTSARIDISFLNPGMYYYNIQDINNTAESGKFVKY